MSPPGMSDQAPPAVVCTCTAFHLPPVFELYMLKAMVEGW
jgi:hypothetical protein